MPTFVESNQSFTNDGQKAISRKLGRGCTHATFLNRKPKFMFLMKEIISSGVVNNCTFLHELVQHCFPKPTITMNALGAIYSSNKAKKVMLISCCHCCNTLLNEEIVKTPKHKKQKPTKQQHKPHPNFVALLLLLGKLQAVEPCNLEIRIMTS